mmetsp:Transcript_4288/g.5267  ORF Transcript_4288/g.5267 Transcript_4288/m.5267 type:complete len:208 (-) Transcript_4288:239-862(-)
MTTSNVPNTNLRTTTTVVLMVPMKRWSTTLELTVLPREDPSSLVCSPMTPVLTLPITMEEEPPSSTLKENPSHTVTPPLSMTNATLAEKLARPTNTDTKKWKSRKLAEMYTPWPESVKLPSRDTTPTLTRTPANTFLELPLPLPMESSTLQEVARTRLPMPLLESLRAPLSSLDPTCTTSRPSSTVERLTFRIKMAYGSCLVFRRWY